MPSQNKNHWGAPLKPLCTIAYSYSCNRCDAARRAHLLESIFTTGIVGDGSDTQKLPSEASDTPSGKPGKPFSSTSVFPACRRSVHCCPVCRKCHNNWPARVVPAGRQARRQHRSCWHATDLGTPQPVSVQGHAAGLCYNEEVPVLRQFHPIGKPQALCQNSSLLGLWAVLQKSACIRKVRWQLGICKCQTTLISLGLHAEGTQHAVKQAGHAGLGQGVPAQVLRGKRAVSGALPTVKSGTSSWYRVSGRWRVRPVAHL